MNIDAIKLESLANCGTAFRFINEIRRCKFQLGGEGVVRTGWGDSLRVVDELTENRVN
jgi:hypothetical protein